MRHLYLVAIVAATAVAITLTNGQRVDIPTECPTVDGDYAVHIADPTDCQKFYKCYHGVRVSTPCPVSKDGGFQLRFNAELQVCDWPWNVNCDNDEKPPVFPPTRPTTRPPTFPPILPTSSSTTKSTSTTSSTTQPPPVVPGRPGSCPSFGSVRIPHEIDCTMYYDCERGQKAGPYHCRDGLFFNPLVQQCDRPENVLNCP